jgi:hypothetical protein
MLRTIIVTSVLAGAITLLTAPQVFAYGVTHTGHTTYTQGGGVQHTGSTTATGPNGSYSGSHSGSYSGTGTATHSGSGTYSGAGGTATHTSSGSYSGGSGTASYSGSRERTYSPTTYSGYSAAGSVSETTTRSVVRYP